MGMAMGIGTVRTVTLSNAIQTTAQNGTYSKYLSGRKLKAMANGIPPHLGTLGGNRAERRQQVRSKVWYRNFERTSR